DELVDAVALCGPKARIAERLEAWQASPITTLNMTTFDPAAVRVMAELVMGTAAGRPDRTIAIPDAPAPAPAGPTPASIFEHMAARVAADPKLPAKVNARFQFDLAGEQGGSWVVDMTGAGEVRTGTVPNADC